MLMGASSAQRPGMTRDKMALTNRHVERESTQCGDVYLGLVVGKIELAKTAVNHR